MKLVSIIAAGLMLLSSALFAQNANESASQTANQTASQVANNTAAEDSLMEEEVGLPTPRDFARRGISRIGRSEYALSTMVLFLCLFVITLEVFLIVKLNIDGNNAIKLVIITLIVSCTLFLLTMRADNDQVAPAMGLFGTVAGYLLGRQDTAGKPKATDGKAEG